MSKKLVVLMFLAIILTGLVMASTNVHKVEAQLGTIYIRADGSIDPPTAPITSFDNVTYTFTADINAFIVVEKNNIVVDGAGYTLQGGGDGTGIQLWERNNVTIKNMEIRAFYHGIYIYRSSNTIISGNNIRTCTNGVDMSSFLSNNIMSGNTITGVGTGFGIALWVGVTNTTVFGNSVTNFTRGVSLWDAPLSYNTIFENNITNNSYGFHVEQMSNNIIYHNNVIDNVQAYWVANTMWFNFWDNGLEGNFWSNYNGTDSNRDGIGDTVYNITQDNTDRYPLMGPFSSFNTSLGKRVNVISNSTIDSFQYFESNTTIRMHVSNVTASQTRGFCRISIPYDVMVEPFTVTIDGVSPTYWNYTLYDNGTHRWMYFAYEHSTLEIIIVPEFPSFLVLPLFMITTLLAVIVYGRQFRKENVSVLRRNF